MVHRSAGLHRALHPGQYLIIYGVLGLLQSGSVMVAMAIAMVATLKAATKLHGTMLSRILRSPMAFFDTTPLGRVLNRFLKDMVSLKPV